MRGEEIQARCDASEIRLNDGMHDARTYRAGARSNGAEIWGSSKNISEEKGVAEGDTPYEDQKQTLMTDLDLLVNLSMAVAVS